LLPDQRVAAQLEPGARLRPRRPGARWQDVVAALTASLIRATHGQDSSTDARPMSFGVVIRSMHTVGRVGRPAGVLRLSGAPV